MESAALTYMSMYLSETQVQNVLCLSMGKSWYDTAAFFMHCSYREAITSRSSAEARSGWESAGEKLAALMTISNEAIPNRLMCFKIVSQQRINVSIVAYPHHSEGQGHAAKPLSHPCAPTPHGQAFVAEFPLGKGSANVLCGL